MVFSGIVFDFNGTLFWDTEKHNTAWEVFSTELRGYPLTADEMREMVIGRTNPTIIRSLLGDSIDEATVHQLTSRKEALYRDLCKEDPENLKLAPGAIDLLDYLQDNDVPFTIATSSERSNIDFYFEVFGLDRWFSLESMVYDDGTLLGKPEPDIFLRAFKLLGLSPEECIVVEDSLSGIEAARRAEAGCIIAVAGDGKEGLERAVDPQHVIHDFHEFDRTLVG